MLPLEDQVCAVEHAKRFKELGIKQYSLFYWMGNFEKSPRVCFPEQERDRYIIETVLPNAAIYSAFTVAELGEMLPDFFDSGKRNNEWLCRSLSPKSSYTYGENEADARAKMLIHLLENKLITVEEINKCHG